MKKTLRKSLAALLAVLMVAFSVPFTALAANFTLPNYSDVYDENVKCWYKGEYPISADEINNFDGYNSEAGGENGIPFGAHVDVVDWELPVILDNYHPTLSIGVTDISTASNRTKYFGYNKTYNYTKVKESGLILDPSHLEKGQRIAVTFVIGGTDMMYMSQIKGTFDNTKLAPAYYQSASKWTQITTGGTTAWIKKGAINGVFSGTPYLDVDTSIFTYVALQDSDQGQYGSTFMDGVDILLEEDSESTLANGMNEYGYTLGTLSFEVLEDCNLAEALNMDDPCAEQSHLTTFITPFSPEYAGVKCRIMSGCREGKNDPAQYCHSLLAINYIDATPVSGGDETPEYTVTFNDADGNTISTATYAEGTSAADVAVPDLPAASFDSTNHWSYAWDAEVADVTADATYSIVKTTEAHSLSANVVSAPTCAQNGETEWSCACGYSETEYPNATGHNYTYTANWDTADWDTNTVTIDMTCPNENCDAPTTTTTAVATPTGNELQPTGSTAGWVEYAVAIDGVTIENATYKKSVDALGQVTYTFVFANGTTSTQTVDNGQSPTIPSNSGNVYTMIEGTNTHNVQSYSWVLNGTTYTEQLNAGTPEECFFGAWSATTGADCTTDGTHSRTCLICGNVDTETVVDSKLGHDFSVEVEKVEATVKTDGYTLYKCSRCDETEIRDIVPAIGVNITIDANTVSAVTINGEAVAAGETVNVPYGSQVDLAVDTADAELVGWSANGTKIISSDAALTITAIADVTYQPIVKPAQADKFTVVFYDMFQNVIDVQTVASAAEIQEPTAPVFTGYTFDGWDTDLTTIAADAVVNAKYTAIADPLYTVTADGCTITIDGAEVDGTGIAYDTLVTVSCPGAKSWQINEATVAYGDTYSFYVGSDVTVVPVMDDVASTVPVVAAVSTTKTDTCAVVFLATRALDGGRYVNAGFVYGKNLADSDLVLEKVGKTGSNAGSGAVKAYYCATNALQFSLTYGVTAQAGTASVRAFLAYIDTNGDTQVTYGNVQSYNYDTGVAK